MADQAETTEKTTFTVTIDGKEIEAEKGEWVIAAAERHGVYIPRFCYHPRMRPVGMCRMCLVEIDTGRGPALQTACTIPAADGMSVVTDSPRVKKAQDGVLEFLLINHPLDCPVCDKGGECPLQDQTLAFGPGESRFVEEKRHYEKPIAISELVYLDRERCILCDRCTRFADEVAGDPLISFVERGNQTQVNTYPDDPFRSYFSGNTVQLCPVGALLAIPYRFRARPWDLDQVESTCTTCAVGCRIAVQSSSNRILRYLGVDVDPVNHGWLCDRGRFDYEAVNSDDRLGAPRLRRGDALVEVGWGEALSAAATALKDAGGPESIGVVGGARLTNEDAYAWAKLLKGVLGTDNVDAQLGDGLPAEAVLGLPRATIDQACAASTVVLLGGDVKEELPVLYLRLREAAVSGGVRLLELSPADTGLTRYATASLRYAPGEVHHLVQQVLDATPDGTDDTSRAGDLLRGAGDEIVCVLGRPSLAESPDAVVAAASALLEAVPGITFLSGLRRGNVHGALDMGLAPGLLPGRVTLDDGRDALDGAWPTTPDGRGLDAAGILTAAADGRLGAVVLLGADPLGDFPDRDLARRALAGARSVIAVDCFLTESVAQADVVLAAAAFGERRGTTTNLEGRVSRLTPKITPPGTARDDWMIAAELAFRLGADLGVESVEEIQAEIERVAPSHAGLTADVLSSSAALDGVVVPLEGAVPDAATTRPAQTEVPAQVAADEQFGPRGVEQTVTSGSVPAAAEPQGGTTARAPEEQAEAQAAAGDEPAGDRQAGDGDDQAAAEASSEAAEQQAAEGPVEEDADDDESAAPRRPSLLRFAPTTAPAPPPLNSYAVRVVASRKLYDQATFTERSPSLAKLVPGATVRVNPAELERLGVGSGDTVRVTSGRGSQTVAATADPTVPRGVAVVWFNQPGMQAGDLIDIAQPVTDVRLETVRPGEA